MYIDYRFSDAVNMQAGLYFTPIGYHNRFLYSRAWLTYSVQVNPLFEEELNLIPTHTVGVNLHGGFRRFDQTFKYAVGVGNGRQAAPTDVAYNRAPETFEGNPELTGLLEWHAPIDGQLVIGISGWTTGMNTVYVPELGGSFDIHDPSAIRAELRETGVPYSNSVVQFSDKSNRRPRPSGGRPRRPLGFPPSGLT